MCDEHLTAGEQFLLSDLLREIHDYSEKEQPIFKHRVDVGQKQTHIDKEEKRNTPHKPRRLIKRESDVHGRRRRSQGRTKSMDSKMSEEDDTNSWKGQSTSSKTGEKF